jgi:hypothetical protein
VTYFNGQIHVWFDMGWRQAGGTTNFAATLKLQLNNVTYLTITTVAGNSPGNAVATLANGASLGANTPSTYTNTGGGGSVSQWNTIHVIIPYSGTVPPDLSFVMSGGGGVSDDFAIDRKMAAAIPKPSPVRPCAIVFNWQTRPTTPRQRQLPFQTRFRHYRSHMLRAASGSTGPCQEDSATLTAYPEAA